MKLLTSALVALALTFAGASQASAAKWNLDGAHAFALFKVMHMGIAPAFGQFVKIGGNLDFDPADPAATKLSVEIDAESVFSGNKKRDDHLKGPDFFNAKQFPKLTFESTGWKKTGDDTYEVTGNMTMVGKTQPMTISVTRSGMGKDPWGNDRVGMTANVSIDRSLFGINWGLDNGGAGKMVDLMLSFEFVKQK